MDDFSVNRNVGVGLFRLNHVAKGLEKSPAVQKLLSEEHLMKDLWEKLLLKVVPFRDGYMWVEEYGCIVSICQDHLEKADLTTLYLDFVHELVHVMQCLKGRKLRDPRYSYVERPTEIEAYQRTVEEAMRIGLEEDVVLEYLRMDWLGDEDYRRLVENVWLKKKIERKRK